MQTSERELPAVFLDVLHSSNQNRESRAVDVSDARKIDHEPARLLANHLAESRSYPGRDVQIDFAYQRQNIFFFRKGHVAFLGLSKCHSIAVAIRYFEERHADFEGFDSGVAASAVSTSGKI